MRLASRLLAFILVIGLAMPSGTAAAPPGPKVAVVVGPVGEATERYLDRGEAAARAAERYTSNVVRVFTPNATWPRVKQALDGAALVVYLGHGNGWPSRYRNELYPPTQNGFGLNPVAGEGHDAHQYFGEGRIRDEVRLADNAVVLLHHLCYASGNTEPGLPEGTIDEARQRVDNYAAGFIAVGAAAVVAEGHMSPAWYVDQVLSTNRTIEEIWSRAPTAHGNAFTFASRRSPGFTAAMDPDQPGGGFYRSLVARSGARLADAAAAGPPAPTEVEPTLAGGGLELGVPYFKGRTVAGSRVEVWVPYVTAGADPSGNLTVGVRWDAIDVNVSGAGQEGSAGEDPPPSAPTAAPSAAPTDAPPAGTPDEAPDAPPPVDRIVLVHPEVPGAVVEPVAIEAGPTRLRVPLDVPASPGRYRLVLTLHDADGVAYDAATQDLLPELIVRVTAQLAAAWVAPPDVRLEAGWSFEIPAALANVGSVPWGGRGGGLRLGRTADPMPHATAVAHWVRLQADGDADAPLGVADPRVRLPAGFESGAAQPVVIRGTAPSQPGQYLLVLDVLVPGHGSLVAAGNEPALVRVVVE